MEQSILKILKMVPIAHIKLFLPMHPHDLDWRGQGDESFFPDGPASVKLITCIPFPAPQLLETIQISHYPTPFPSSLPGVGIHV